MRIALFVLAASTALVSAPAFVDFHDTAPKVRIEMRYAMKDNFLHEAVYPCARCLLRRDAAKALGKAQRAVEKKGFGLKVWDCYRPVAVQEAMWRIEPDPRFVADPKKGSVHNRGGAVDITLVTATGGELEMPTKHDDFSDAAFANAPASADATMHRAILRSAMEGAGFTVMPTEWWHFDYAGSRAWPIENVELCLPER